MKTIKAKNFGLFKVADSLIENISKSHLSDKKVTNFRKVFKSYKNQLFIGINPADKTLFHFISFFFDFVSLESEIHSFHSSNLILGFDIPLRS